MGSLIVYSIDGGKEEKETTVYVKNGTQLQKWRRAFVRLDSEGINNDFKIAIDAYIGKGFLGII